MVNRKGINIPGPTLYTTNCMPFSYITLYSIFFLKVGQNRLLYCF